MAPAAAANPGMAPWVPGNCGTMSVCIELASTSINAIVVCGSSDEVDELIVTVGVAASLDTNVKGAAVKAALDDGGECAGPYDPGPRLCALADRALVDVLLAPDRDIFSQGLKDKQSKLWLRGYTELITSQKP